MVGPFACVFAVSAGDVRADAVIAVPVRFHVADNLVMDKAGVSMNSWVTERQIRDTVVPEVNRIWQAAGVRVVVDGVVPATLIPAVDRGRWVDLIVNARRDEDGESDPERIRHLGRIIDFDSQDRSMVHVTLVPYLGEASQGNTKRRFRRIVVGQWTDKPTRGRQAPERFALVEPGPFVRGSLARTVAHELGHVLGLRHPDKREPGPGGLLMGGRKPGYGLTRDEIITAREAARAIADRHAAD